MSLRGNETTEAISQGLENREIATLSSFARNDKKRIETQSPGKRRISGVILTLCFNEYLQIGELSMKMQDSRSQWSPSHVSSSQEGIGYAMSILQ
jgi:hypothetical protein